MGRYLLTVIGLSFAIHAHMAEAFELPTVCNDLEHAAPSDLALLVTVAKSIPTNEVCSDSLKTAKMANCLFRAALVLSEKAAGIAAQGKQEDPALSLQQISEFKEAAAALNSTASQLSRACQ
jgi:hypothetical protein